MPASNPLPRLQAAEGPSREARSTELGMMLAILAMESVGLQFPCRREAPPRKVVAPKKSKRAKVKAARKARLKATQP